MNKISVLKPRIVAGDPVPLGATWDGRGVNFALFSAHATRVELCLYDATGTRETGRRGRRREKMSRSLSNLVTAARLGLRKVTGPVTRSRWKCHEICASDL